MSSVALRLAALMSFCALAACAETNTVYRNRTLGDPGIVTVDAKQRSTYSAKVNNHLAICAEAAPDAFSAMSMSAAGELGLNPNKQELQTRAAIALAEAAGTIERTQTINLLRESMYRTCERYISGAISKEEFVVQAARDSRNMVSVLAIEQLTGAVRRPSTILVAGGTTADVRSPGETAVLIERAAERLARAEIEKKSADQALDAAGGEAGCKALTSDPKDADKKAACDTATRRLSAATTELSLAQKVHASILEAAKAGGLGAGMSASTTAETPNSGAGGGQEQGVKSDLATVAKAVVDIVKTADGFNEIEMMCIRIALRDDSAAGQAAAVTKTESQVREEAGRATVRDACLTLVAAKTRMQASDYIQQVNALRSVRALDRETANKDLIIDQILAKLQAPAEWRTGPAGLAAPPAEARAKLKNAILATQINVNMADRVYDTGTTFPLLGEVLRDLEEQQLKNVLTQLQ